MDWVYIGISGAIMSEVEGEVEEVEPPWRASREARRRCLADLAGWVY